MDREDTNLQVRLEGAGSKLVFEVDLSRDLGLGPSGKAVIVASSGGWRILQEDKHVSYSLVVTRRASGEEYKGGRRA